MFILVAHTKLVDTHQTLLSLQAAFQHKKKVFHQAGNAPD